MQEFYKKTGYPTLKMLGSQRYLSMSELAIIKLGIKSFFHEKFIMSALLYNLSVAHNKN
jgi:hypothetical protein